MNLILRKIGALTIAAVFPLTLTGCGGATSTPPTARKPQMTVCPQSVTQDIRTESGCTAGGGGGGFVPINSHAQALVDNISSQGQNNAVNQYEIDGSGTNNATGAQVATTTMTITSDQTDGSNAITLNDAYGSHTLSITDGAFIDTTLPVQQIGGVTLYAPNGNSSTATFQDAYGRTWTLTGTPETDHFHFDVTFTLSDGQTDSARYTYNEFAPYAIYGQGAPNSPSSVGRRPMETGAISLTTCQSPCGQMPNMNDPQATMIGMGVLAGMTWGLSVGVSMFSGGQPLSQNLSQAAQAFSAMAAAAAAADYQQHHKNGKKN